MMLLTTGAIAAICLILLWFIFLQRIRWAWLSYTLVVILGAAFIASGAVHFVYIGIEIIGFGCAIVWWQHRFRRPAGKA